MAKSVMDIMLQIGELTDSASKAGEHLQLGMDELTERYETALTKWQQAGEATQEVWDTVNPLGKLIGTSLGAVDGRLKVFGAKLQMLEAKSSKVVKEVLKLVEEIKKVEAKAKGRKNEDKITSMGAKSDKLFEEVQNLQTALKKDWAYSESVKATLALYKNKRNTVLKHTKFSSEIAAVGAALGFLIKGIVEVAKHV